MHTHYKHFQRVLTLILMLAMLFSCFALCASAAGQEDTSKVRVYIRAFDFNKTKELTLEKQGNWIGARYREAFPDAEVKVSTERLTKQQFFDEIDEFFKDADSNDVNIINFSGHGSTDGYIFLHNTEGTLLSTIRKNHIDNIPGKVFLFVSACYSGRWIDVDFGGTSRTTFRSEVDSFGDKYSILMDGEEESTYIPNGEGPNADTCGKWADGLAITTDEYGCKHIKADRNDDGRLTVEELYLFGLSAPNKRNTMRYPLHDNTVLLTVPSYSAVFNACDGTFEGGGDWAAVQSSDTPTVSEPPVPQRDGLVFDGWYTKASGGEKVSFPFTLDRNVKLWAHWTKDGEADLSHEVSQWDTLRIPLTNGSYADFLIVDKEHTCNSFELTSMKCETDNGMFLISKNSPGTVQYCDSLDELGNWEKSNIREWCVMYYDWFPTEMQGLVRSATVSVPGGKTSEEKLYILSGREADKCLPKTMLPQILSGFTWERIVSSNTCLPYMNSSGTHMALAETASNLRNAIYSFRPVINLSISADDLVYDHETKTFGLKALQGVEIRPHYEGVDKDYFIRVNGTVTYKATGERDAVCDRMNTMAMVPWSISDPIYYNYMGNLRSNMQAGSYRGIPYANTYDRDFHYIDRIDECFAEGETCVRGLECSSAVAYGLRDGIGLTGDELLNKGSAYDCRDYVADGLHVGTGTMKRIGGGTFSYADCMTYVGDYGSYVISDESPDTQFIIADIIKTANYKHGTIYDNVYAKIMPGDALVRHYDYIVGDTNVTSHAQTCTGVDLVYGEDGLIDPDKSTVSFVDISAPHNSILKTTGEYTAWTTDDTQKSNKMTFRYMTDEGFVIPVTMNRWLDDTESVHHTLTKVKAVAAACKTDGSIEYYECSACGLRFTDARGETVITNEECIIPAKGHHYVDGVCENCGEDDPDAEPSTPDTCIFGSLFSRIFDAILDFFRRIFSWLPFV